MLKAVSKINQWLNKNMFIVVSCAVVVGFMHPMEVSSLLKRFSIALFAYMTFVTALGVSFRRFLEVLRRPWIAILCLLLVHILSPLLAWLVGLAFFPQDPLMRLGFLVAASIPTAVTAIMWTALVRGDVTISIMTVTMDALIVPVFLPLFFLLVARQTIQVDAMKMFWQMVWMVTAPSITGMVLRDWTQGKFEALTHSVGGLTAKIALSFVVFLNASVVAPYFEWSWLMLKTLSVVLLLVVMGYGIGYLGSFLLRQRSPDRIAAMIYNVGMRNNTFGLVLALSYFQPAVALPITFAMLFQQPVAGIISNILLARNSGRES